MELFGERLKRLRLEKGVSQLALAKVIGITPQTLKKWEMGSGRVTLRKIVTICKYFKVSTDYLLGLKD